MEGRRRGWSMGVQGVRRRRRGEREGRGQRGGRRKGGPNGCGVPKGGGVSKRSGVSVQSTGALCHLNSDLELPASHAYPRHLLQLRHFHLSSSNSSFRTPALFTIFSFHSFSLLLEHHLSLPFSHRPPRCRSSSRCSIATAASKYVSSFSFLWPVSQHEARVAATVASTAALSPCSNLFSSHSTLSKTWTHVAVPYPGCPKVQSSHLRLLRRPPCSSLPPFVRHVAIVIDVLVDIQAGPCRLLQSFSNTVSKCARALHTLTFASAWAIIVPQADPLVIKDHCLTHILYNNFPLRVSSAASASCHHVL